VTMINDEVEIALTHLRALQPGETYVYHEGRLDVDRTGHNIQTVGRVAAEASRLVELGFVTLVQERIGDPRTREGKIDRVNGESAFRYIARGIPWRAPKKKAR